MYVCVPASYSKPQPIIGSSPGFHVFGIFVGADELVLVFESLLFIVERCQQKNCCKSRDFNQSMIHDSKQPDRIFLLWKHQLELGRNYFVLNPIRTVPVRSRWVVGCLKCMKSLDRIFSKP